MTTCTDKIKNKLLRESLRALQQNQLTEDEFFNILAQVDASAEDFKYTAMSLTVGLECLVGAYEKLVHDTYHLPQH